MSYFIKTRFKNSKKGAIIVPVLIWGGITVLGAAGAWWAGKTALAGAVADFLAGLLIWVSYLFQYLSRFLCFTATDVFDNSLTLFNKTITKNPDFLKGWRLVRDFSNMFIVLGFVIVGLATTLRIRDYEAKKLLLPLILTAILINFSGLFCGLIIDASNILATSLISDAGIEVPKTGGSVQGAVGGLGKNFYTMAVKFVDDGLSSISEGTDKAGNLEFLKINIMVSFVFLAIAGTFFYMAILFIARYVILAFLFILSPLAFVCKIFPISRTQEIWKMWWENFLKWAFIGVGGTLSLWISASFMKSVTTEIAENKATLGIENLFVILLFLIIGFKITTKSSAAGAGAIMGLAQKGTMMAGGAVLWGTGKTAGATGLKGLAKRGGEAVKDKATAAGERLGLVNQGTTKLNQQNRLKEATAGLSAKYEDNAEGNAGLAKIATSRAITSQQKKEKAAAGEILAKRNAMGAIEESKREGVARYSTASGADKNTFTKVDPSLSFKTDRQKDKEAKQQLMSEEKVRLEEQYAGTSATDDEKARLIKKHMAKYTPSEAAIIAKKQDMAKAKVKENKLGFATVTDQDAIARERANYKPTMAEIDKAKTDMDAQRIAAARGGPVPPTTNEQAIEHLKSQYNPSQTDITKSKGEITAERIREKAIGFKHASSDEAYNSLVARERDELKKSDPTLSGKKLDEALEAQVKNIRGNAINAEQGRLNKERMTEAIKKLSGPKLTDMAKETINEDTVTLFSADQLKKIKRDGSADLSDQFKKYITKGTTERDALITKLSTASPAEKKALKEAYANLVRHFKEK